MPKFEQRILIVDDMQTMRKIVNQKLTFLGYANLVEAADGEQAWEALDKANPPFDLVISDLNMPNLSGVDLLKRVRRDKRFENLPFIMLTAEGELTRMTEAIQAGVTAYMLKPFSLEAIREKLKTVLHGEKEA